MAESFWKKAITTAVVAVTLAFVYETTTSDSWHAARGGGPVESTGALRPGARLQFAATAYCKGETTASGVAARTGVAAADPALLPVGTVVRIDTPSPRYSGIWTVMDTGPAVRGRVVDLYLWSCTEALQFGRRQVHLTVLRLGWNPENSAPSLIDSLFHQRERGSETPAPESAPPKDR